MMKGYPCPEAGGTIGIYPPGKFHQFAGSVRDSVNNADGVNGANKAFSPRPVEGHRLSLRNSR